jgi:NDP-sugar pyrophosphorylase family protein
MMAVILAGGKGTRLRPYSISIPKPLMPIGDVPIVEILLHQLAAAGFDRIVISIGHLAHLFSAVLGSGERFGLRLEYVNEDTPLGTAGALRLIDGIADNFLVMNGDVLTTLDFGELFRFHTRKNALATIAVHQRSVAIDYGVVEVSPDGLLSRFVEKPTIPYRVSMGVNVLSCRAVDFVPKAERFDMPQLMEALREAGGPVACYETGCYWMDIGRFDDYQQASADFDAGAERFLPMPKGK